MLKRLLLTGFVFILLLYCAGCSKPLYPDYSEIEKRLTKISPDYAFDYNSLFCADGTFFVFYSYRQENDFLLTLKTDEKNRVSQLTLTVKNEAESETLAYFADFCGALILSYVPKAHQTALLTVVNAIPQTPGWKIFTEQTSAGAYSASLITDDLGLCFLLNGLEPLTEAASE